MTTAKFNPIKIALETAAKEKKTIELQGGPNKLELVHALMNSSNVRPLHVGFKMRQYFPGDIPYVDTFVNVRIGSIQREDGSGNYFNIVGSVVGDVAFLKVKIFFVTKRNSGPDCGFIMLAD